MNQTNMAALLLNQQQAHKNDPYPDVSTRIDRIDRLADMVVRHSDAICETLMADYGNRSPISTKASEVLTVIESCNYAKKHIAHWMKIQRRKTKFPFSLMGAKSLVLHQPLGVVGNISAWNFPIQLSLAPLVDIFSAGNRAMLKPSELSSHSSDLLAKIIKDSFDEDELAVVLGGAETAAQFSSLRFDHLLFTGSTHVGKLVAQAAAANLVPVTLELGGKNPVVISESADVALAAEKVMWSKTLNGGQICLSPDTVLVQEGIVSEFVESCKKSVAKMYPNIESDMDYTHIINDRHADRLRALVSEVEADGSTVIHLGEGSGRCVTPSLILDPKLDSKMMNEEIFGGPLPIVTYSSIEQAIEFINDRPKPLALYYFGTNKNEINLVTRLTSSGGMVVNDCLAHHLQEDLPFGGVGDSGTGAYHGYDGFKNFSHARAVHNQSKLDPFRMIRPPFGEKMRGYAEKQIKR